jgi:hypothetical protein
VVDTLTVDVSRTELHEVTPETLEFETDGTFELVFDNHDRAAHVHVHPDDALARGVDVGEPNVYVETESREVVTVTVPDGPRPFRGSLDVSAGYGAGEATIAVAIVDDPTPDLPVDESLGDAPAQPAESTRSLSPASVLDTESVPVLVLAIIALVIAGAVATTISNPVVGIGAIVVVVGVLAAIYALLLD